MKGVNRLQDMLVNLNVWEMTVVPRVLHKGGAHSLFNHLWDPTLQNKSYRAKSESEFLHAGPVSFLSQSVN